jgi:hypothetical protein
MQLVPNHLASLANLCSDDTRWATNGVKVSLDTDGTYSAVVTNTRSLLKVSGASAPLDVYPVPQAVLSAPNGASSGIVPGNVWQKFMINANKLTRRKEKSQPILANVVMQFSKDQVTLGATDCEESPTQNSKLAEGRFPPVEEVLNLHGKPVAKFILGGAELAKLLRTMLSAVPDEESDKVTFEFFGASKPVRLTRQNVDISGIAAIMPIFDKAVLDEDASLRKPINSTSVQVQEALQEAREEFTKELAESKEELARAKEELARMQEELATARRAIKCLEHSGRQLVDEREHLQATLLKRSATVQQAATQPMPKSRRERLGLK